MAALKSSASVNLLFCKDQIPEQVINYLVRQRLLGECNVLKSSVGDYPNTLLAEQITGTQTTKPNSCQTLRETTVR